MPKKVTTTYAGISYPISTGELTLVGGTQTETGIDGHDPGAAQLQSVVMVSRRVAGGTLGELTYVWDPVGGTLKITSENVLDTSVCEYMIHGK